MSDFDYLGGEVSESTTYVPVPKVHYRARIVRAEMVDPVALWGEPGEDLSPADATEYRRLFPQLTWQIESLENGDVTEYAGRTVRQRLSFRKGANPKSGEPYQKPLADLIRLANGLGAKTEVTGYKLIDVNVNGVDREEAVAMATHALQKYEGLVGTIRIYHTKQGREAVGGILLPAEA